MFTFKKLELENFGFFLHKLNNQLSKQLQLI